MPSHRSMASGVVRVGQAVDEFLVALRPAASSGGHAPPPATQAGYPAVGLGCDQILQDDLVFPAVAEVVLVAERVTFATGQVPQGGSALVAQREVPVGDAIADGVVDEHVQVRVGPSHGGLDHMVEAVQADRRGHEQAPPDRRIDVQQGDREAEHLRDWRPVRG